ncbi:hypothetical protein BRD17_09060 [Halobacteriales archaeon SW_7_68_16]|nr:MAG: hypothetical protein BRD17_09060 [Halobacteriales archaeon SW_7_68_16]
MAEYPRGTIARVEAQSSHREFVRAAEPEYVMLKLNHARRIVKRDMTAAEFFGEEPTVIVTSTINDTTLNLMPWEHEWEYVREFRPDYHIPTDFSIYESQEPEERRENVRECMAGTLWMRERIVDHGLDVDLIPLVKGLEPEEREICYGVFRDAGFDCAAFYGTQYFTGDSGAQITQLEQDVRDIDRESDVDVLLIGLMSATYLERMPPNVVAAAGQNQWRKRINLRDDDPEEMHAAYADLADQVDEALSVSESLTDPAHARAGATED